MQSRSPPSPSTFRIHDCVARAWKQHWPQPPWQLLLIASDVNIRCYLLTWQLLVSAGGDRCIFFIFVSTFVPSPMYLKMVTSIAFVIFLAFLPVIKAAYPAPSFHRDTERQFSTSSRLSIPIHGNWCGPGHGGVLSTEPCIDRLDCACRAHDFCYSRYQSANCRCDTDVRDAMPGPKTAKEHLVAAYFNLSPCQAPKESSYVKNCRKCSNIPPSTYVDW